MWLRSVHSIKQTIYWMIFVEEIWTALGEFIMNINTMIILLYNVECNPRLNNPRISWDYWVVKSLRKEANKWLFTTSIVVFVKHLYYIIGSQYPVENFVYKTQAEHQINITIFANVTRRCNLQIQPADVSDTKSIYLLFWQRYNGRN